MIINTLFSVMSLRETEGVIEHTQVQLLIALFSFSQGVFLATQVICPVNEKRGSPVAGDHWLPHHIIRQGQHRPAILAMSRIAPVGPFAALAWGEVPRKPLRPPVAPLPQMLLNEESAPMGAAAIPALVAAPAAVHSHTRAWRSLAQSRCEVSRRISPEQHTAAHIAGSTDGAWPGR